MEWHLLFISVALQVCHLIAQSCTDLEKFKDFERVVTHCKGNKVLGSSIDTYVFEANALYEHEFNSLFETTEEVIQM
ncbi:hypothetical protein GCK32_020169 [Trichostrongylus colubriformis]